LIRFRPFSSVCLCALVLAGPRAGFCQAPEAALQVAQPVERAARGSSPEPAATALPEAPRLKAPGWGDLFKPLGGDFRRLASEDNLLLATVGAAGSLTFHSVDRSVATASWGRGVVEEALEPGALVGGFLFQTGTAFTTYAIGRATNQPRLALIGADLVRAQLVAQTVTQTVKFTSRRTRPDGTTLSFPSGHTASAFATATVLQSHLGWKVGVPAYAMASWVAASRVHMDRHYVSDVIMGATVGLLAGRSVTFGRGDARFAVAPMAVPGGIGFSIAQVRKR
jgi:membrane-associated phospholipid phosphatase